MPCLTQRNRWSVPPRKKEPYKEFQTERVFSNDGTYIEKLVEVTLDHPCNDVNANHYKLDVLLEVSPDNISKSNFIVDSPLDLVDSIRNTANTIINNNERISE